MVGPFTETANPVIYIPDPRSTRVKRERRQTRRIRNDMDESEFVRGYSAALHVIRVDTRINVVQTMMLTQFC
jgi:hypothetical protein